MFLDVQKRGPSAFEGLVKCLEESDNSVAANILDSKVEIKTLPSPMPDDQLKLVLMKNMRLILGLRILILYIWTSVKILSSDFRYSGLRIFVEVWYFQIYDF